MSNKQAGTILKRAEKAFDSTERKNAEPRWDILSEFLLNNQSGIFTGSGPANTLASEQTPGAKKTQRVFDSTGMQAARDLAASFQGTITNPATTWSKIRYTDDKLNDNEEAVKWLEEVNRIMHNKFNESNFDTEIGKGYQSFTALGSMALFHEPQDDGEAGLLEGFRFSALHLAEVVWEENKDKLVETVYRKFDMSARQAVEKWGVENLADKIIECLEKDPDKKFKFLHAIYKRDPKEVKLNSVGLAPAKERPFASLYIDMSSGNVVEESGYYEFPVHVARWELMPGEVYGRGPGHVSIPDVRTLNRLRQRALEAIDLQVRPPIFANQRDIFGPLDMRPNAVNILRDINGVREFATQARTDVVQFSQEDLRNSIRQTFFLDKLLLPPRNETGEMTAFEVAERTSQMQRVLGPVMSRLNSELLSPMIVRSFKMLLRSGQLPEMPNVIKEQGLDIEIVFVNSLARAQQVEDIQTIQQLAQQMAFMAQVNPEVVDNFDVDGAFRHIAKTLGVPEVVVKGADEVAELRQVRAQQQQQAVAMQQANMAADTAAKAGLTGNGEEGF